MLPLLENFHHASQYSFRIFYLSWKIFILPVNILSELGISWNDQAGCISFFVKSDNGDDDEIWVGMGDGKHNHEGDEHGDEHLRRPDPPAIVMARQAIIAFQG